MHGSHVCKMHLHFTSRNPSGDLLLSFQESAGTLGGLQVGEYISKLLDPEHMYETLGGRNSEKVDVDSIRIRMRRLDQERQALLSKALAAAPDEGSLSVVELR